MTCVAYYFCRALSILPTWHIDMTESDVVEDYSFTHFAKYFKEKAIQE